MHPRTGGALSRKGGGADGREKGKAPPERGLSDANGRQAMALTSSGMPGPNVVDTAPFWM
jgi:hypothetical protein